MNNSFLITKSLLDIINVEYTESYLVKSFRTHHKNNTLLCISNILSKYSILSEAIKIDSSRFLDIPHPAIVQIEKEGSYLFYLITDLTDDVITIVNENNNYSKIKTKQFFKIWTGVCLIIEVDSSSGEPGIKNRKNKSRYLNLVKFSGAILLLTWYISSLIGNVKLFEAIFLIINIFGLITSSFLLLHEIDSSNSTLKKFCSSGDNFNCNSVLKSKYSNIFNIDFLSLSIVSFSYFLSSTLTPLVYSFSSNVLSFVSLLSIISFPIIAISLYYQAFVIKKWCKLCLIILATLTLQSLLVISVDNLSYISYSLNNEILLFVSIMLITIASWEFIKRIMKTQKETILLEKTLNGIKFRPNIFENILNSQDKIKNSTKGLGIEFSNSNAKIDVIKVCNPYCEPCASAHPKLERLMKLGLINLQILFIPSANDPRSIPVSHFLTLDKNESKSIVEKAIVDWYSLESKDYEKYLELYPTQVNFEGLKEKINNMSNWCKNEKITQTPTFFINNRKLPNEYKIDDLIELL